ncbi:hypothetical protein ACIGJO_20255 [Streptomyces sp. NPDC079020]|uniref:hypothetical protein n=1 Tax=Streptomyces sp. NPDC079020 TaxID=3365722 RepID=UPI0037D73A0B
MTVLRHSVTVTAVESGRFREVVELLVDFAESTRARGGEIRLADGQPVPDVRLVKGRHLRPGARYEYTDAGTSDRMAVIVREWRPRRSIAVEQVLVSEELTARVTLRLSSPDHLRLVEATARVRGPEGSGALHRGTGRARFDPDAWWAAAGLEPGAPPVARAPATARLKHRLGEARLHLRPRRADGGRWQVDVAATVRGRWLLRPVAALALMVAGRPLRRSFRSAVDRAAEGWNRALDELLAFDPDELRAELARQATERTPEEPDSP